MDVLIQNDAIKAQLTKSQELMEGAVEHAKHDLIKIRAGKASPTMLEGMKVECYGALTPIEQVSSISTPDARTIMIKPWDKNIIKDIERVIVMANHIDITPQNNGESIILNIPPLTEERRIVLTKQVKAEIEKGKVAARNIRKDIKEALKKLQKEGAAEDAIRTAEDDLQKITDKVINELDRILEKKENELMEI